MSKRSLGDEIKDLISRELQIQTETDIPGMVGGFTLVAEYTDPVSGKPRYMSLVDRDLTTWGEIGLLETRLMRIREDWVAQGKDGNGS